MATRKIFVLFAILAGLFAFQGSVAVAMPREGVRTEIVINNKQEVEGVFTAHPLRPEFFVTDVILTSSSHHLIHHSLLLSSIHHHSTL